MAIFVVVNDYGLTLCEVVLDVVGRVGLANEAEAEGGYGVPNEEISGNIASIVSE